MTAPMQMQGPRGRAVMLELPDRPDVAETVCVWIVTAPMYHPVWSQYFLSVVRLRQGVPGFPDPVLKFDGATHELHVVALNPERGPYTAKRVEELDWALPWLEPINIAEQFEATDAEMQQLAAQCVYGILFGLLNPETADAPQQVREHWLTAMVQTLAHIRGEPHAPRPAPPPEHHGPFRPPQPGEEIVTAISPGVTLNEAPQTIAAMRKLTHDGLIRLLGDRRRSGITWYHVFGREKCLEWIDAYVAEAVDETKASVIAIADQYRAFIAEHPTAVIVIASCQAVE